jgi:hypothetical protein
MDIQQDGHSQRPRRMSRSIALVLVGTASLMLGMPGCDDHGGQQNAATTQPSAGSHQHGGYRPGYYGAGHANRGSGTSSAHASRTPRGGFGSTGHSVGS